MANQWSSVMAVAVALTYWILVCQIEPVGAERLLRSTGVTESRAGEESVTKDGYSFMTKLVDLLCMAGKRFFSPPCLAGTSTKAFFKGVETWKRETMMKKSKFQETARLLESASDPNKSPTLEYRPLPSGPPANTERRLPADRETSILENIYWNELMLLVLVWVAFLIVQMFKTHATTCSTGYWALNIMQVPIAASVTLYEAISLYKGKRAIASKGKQDMNCKIHQLLFYCGCGILAGIVGGLLGLGGGFILGPLFLELGVPPQVASSTSTFIMAFSSSMSVVQYYLLDRFPVPYAVFFMVIASVAAFTGQYIVRKLIILLGRASLIIFVLALTIFASAISLGGVGISNMITQMENKEYMGFESLCYH